MNRESYATYRKGKSKEQNQRVDNRMTEGCSLEKLIQPLMESGQRGCN